MDFAARQQTKTRQNQNKTLSHNRITPLPLFFLIIILAEWKVKKTFEIPTQRQGGLGSISITEKDQHRMVLVTGMYGGGRIRYGTVAYQLSSWYAAIVHRTIAFSFSNPPPSRKKTHQTMCLFSGGGGRIRTIEAKRSRFTVCPLWPLGNSPI